jgi:hypothetical protein
LEKVNTLQLKVKDSANLGKRELEVTLGNAKVVKGFEYQVADYGNPITASGNRVWFNNVHSGEHVLFKSFDIKNISE